MRVLLLFIDNILDNLFFSLIIGRKNGPTAVCETNGRPVAIAEYINNGQVKVLPVARFSISVQCM